MRHMFAGREGFRLRDRNPRTNIALNNSTELYEHRKRTDDELHAEGWTTAGKVQFTIRPFLLREKKSNYYIGKCCCTSMKYGAFLWQSETQVPQPVQTS